MSKIVVVAGTNRNDAVTLQVAKIYLEIFKEKGEDAKLIDLAQLPADFVATALYENSGKNIDFNPFLDTMTNAEKFIFVVPEYNGSFPGVLKSFIDGLKYPETFFGKSAALIGISSGTQGGVLGLSHLTDIFNYCGMHVLPFKPRLFSIEANMDGQALGNRYRSYIVRQVQELLDF